MKYFMLLSTRRAILGRRKLSTLTQNVIKLLTTPTVQDKLQIIHKLKQDILTRKTNLIRSENPQKIQYELKSPELPILKPPKDMPHWNSLGVPQATWLLHSLARISET
jgi:uncharacterized ferritin-like protein (DUF455 family)